MKSGRCKLMLAVLLHDLADIWSESTNRSTDPRTIDGLYDQQQPEPTVSRRISSSSARDRKNKYGFSLGLLGLYDSNMFGSDPKEGLWAVAPSPRGLYKSGVAQISTASRLPATLSPLSLHDRDLDGASHEGSFEYAYKISRRTSFSLTDYVRSGPNDILSFTGEGLIPGNPDYQQVFFDSQHTSKQYVSQQARLSADAQAHSSDFRILPGLPIS